MYFFLCYLQGTKKVILELSYFFKVGSQTFIDRGPFIYYVITCRGEGGQKIQIFDYFQY